MGCETVQGCRCELLSRGRLPREKQKQIQALLAGLGVPTTAMWGPLASSQWWAQGPVQCWCSLGMEHVRLSSTVAVPKASPEPGGVFLLLQDTSRSLGLGKGPM